MNEKEIIQGCKKNDRRSQNSLYKLYFPLMSSIALRYSGSKEEALQHINFGFLKVLQNLKQYDEQFALATWIRNILTNHIIDEFRKSKKFENNVSLEDINEYNIEFALNDGEQKLLKENLIELLQKLPEASRIIFTLYAIEGFKHKEIAEKMNIHIGTSKWHVSDARKKLMLMIKTKMELENKCLTTEKL